MITEKKEAHIPYLDGVRGIAILLVWAGHYFAQVYLFQFGWIGVNLFFVLSGYLITGRLFDLLKEDRRDYYKKFYMRRILRIFPLYYGVIIVFFLFLPHFYPRYDVNFSGLYREQVWYWLYIENWRVFLYGYASNATFAHFWSLAVEEQFYLLWPFFFRYGNRFNKKMTIAGILILSIAVRVFGKHTQFTFSSTLTACEPLLLGALLCILEKEGKLLHSKYMVYGSILSITVLAVILSINSDPAYNNVLLMRYGYSCIDFLFIHLMCYLLVGDHRSAVLRKWFTAGWLRWLGKYSYGIYVYHWLILHIFRAPWQRALIAHGVGTGLAYPLSLAGAIAGVLICSYLSYRFYEQPFLRLKRFFV